MSHPGPARAAHPMPESELGNKIGSEWVSRCREVAQRRAEEEGTLTGMHYSRSLRDREMMLEVVLEGASREEKEQAGAKHEIRGFYIEREKRVFKGQRRHATFGV